MTTPGGGLIFEGKPVQIAPAETVLTALLAAGVGLDSSCRVGACQTCMVRALKGRVPKAAQQGLASTLKAQGYFLACVCVPDGPLVIIRANDSRRAAASVLSMDKLSPTVMRLRLIAEQEFNYRSGQFLALQLSNDTVRHYSIASHPESETYLELHVRLIPNGQMCRLLTEDLHCGDRLIVSGPSGSCFYEDIHPDRPIVLAGSGTGLAPLWGILRDALWRGHRGPILLYHGARDANGLYYTHRLCRLAAAHPNFSYHPCIGDEIGPSKPDLIEQVVRVNTEMSDATFFLCGNPDMVQDLKRRLFLKGAKLERLRADAFVPAAGNRRTGSRRDDDSQSM